MLKINAHSALRFATKAAGLLVLFCFASFLQAQEKRLCSDQPIPRDYVIIRGDTDLSCPGFTPGKMNAFIIKKPGESEEICKNSPVPRDYDVVSQGSSMRCPDWQAVGKNTKKIERRPEPSQESSGGFQWIPQHEGQSTPSDAVIGGRENNQSLFICRASYEGGMHPGKLVGGWCNIGWGGKEIILPEFEVLVGDGGQWRSPRRDYRGALEGGTDHGQPLYLCRAGYKGGTHPGKVVRDKCNLSYGGHEVMIADFEVFYATSPGSNSGTGIAKILDGIGDILDQKKRPSSSERNETPRSKQEQVISNDAKPQKNCLYDGSVSQNSFGKEGGSFTVLVNTQDGCNLSSNISESWLYLLQHKNEIKSSTINGQYVQDAVNATFDFRVRPNQTGNARSCTVKIGSFSFTIQQAN